MLYAASARCYKGAGSAECVHAQNGLYCPKSQPARSAYREASFGHGILSFLSPTEAIFEWHRWVACHASCAGRAMHAHINLRPSLMHALP